MRRCVFLSVVLGVTVWVLSLSTTSTINLAYNTRWFAACVLHVIAPILLADYLWFKGKHTLLRFVAILGIYCIAFLATMIPGATILPTEAIVRQVSEGLLLGALLGLVILLLVSHKRIHAKRPRDYSTVLLVVSGIGLLAAMRHSLLRAAFLETTGGWLQIATVEYLEQTDHQERTAGILPLGQWTFTNRSPFLLYAPIEFPLVCLHESTVTSGMYTYEGPQRRKYYGRDVTGWEARDQHFETAVLAKDYAYHLGYDALYDAYHETRFTAPLPPWSRSTYRVGMALPKMGHPGWPYAEIFDNLATKWQSAIINRETVYVVEGSDYDTPAVIPCKKDIAITLSPG